MEEDPECLGQELFRRKRSRKERIRMDSMKTLREVRIRGRKASLFGCPLN